jgi:hypothetical protein
MNCLSQYSEKLRGPSDVEINDLTAVLKYCNTITGVIPLHPTGNVWLSLLCAVFDCCIPFGAKLRDVFVISFACTSHQPVAFCMIRLSVLVPVTAFSL